MSEKGIAHVKKQLEKMKKDGNPGAKYLQKILDNPTNKTNVLRNGIYAHCYDCMWDSADPTGSNPKNCDTKSCPHFSERPMSGKEKSEVKAAKGGDSESKAKKQEQAAKARLGRKSFKECLEAVENALTECCGKGCKDCTCKDDAYTKDELAKKLKVDPSDIKTNSVKGKMDLWMVDGKTFKKK